MNIVGREKEQSVLKRCFDSKKPEFLAIYGRRRVGKTYLIREYFGDSIVFSLTGASRGGAKEQLARFKDAYEIYSGKHAEDVNNWHDAFRLLRIYLEKQITEKKDIAKIVVFLDELPWLATQKSDFVSALEHFWNSWGAAREELLLVVCGSATSWIIKNIIQNRGGLHNRITRRMQIQPYSLGECEEHLRSIGVSLSRMQIAELYMAIGGIPYYLDYADPGLSVPQLIDQMFFDDAAPLAGEFDELYASIFKYPEKHLAIIEALAINASGLPQKELSALIGEKTGGSFSKTIRELEQCGFVRKVREFNKKKNGISYKLIDFYTLFYLKHVRDYSGSDRRYWQNHSMKGAQLAWNGLAFERVCEAHPDQIKQRLGILGVSTYISAWRSKHSKPGVQIDLVIDRDDGIVNLCEIKFTGKKFHIEKSYDSELRERKEVFREETQTRKAIHTTMITASGLDDTSYLGEVQSEVTLDDLFRPVY